MQKRQVLHRRKLALPLQAPVLPSAERQRVTASRLLRRHVSEHIVSRSSRLLSSPPGDATGRSLMTSNESSSEVKQKISKTMRNQVKALIAGQDWPVAVFEQLGGRLDECPGGSVIDRDTALSILGLTIDQAVDKWLIQFSARVRELNDASARAVASEKKERPDSRNQYVETSTDPFSGKTWGKDRHSALIFMEYADRIRREEGTDVYETKAQLEANDSLLRRLIEQYRKDKTFADASIDRKSTRLNS